ncbi:MAG TPA: alpha/beta fold hydrolase [Thermoanaerobaculia bacterium]|nr:alpha/beta fold hydrolase [Thermoanaerobaculia bacterium]
MTRRLIIILAMAVLCVSCATDDSDQLTTASRMLPRGKYSGNETGPTPVGAIPDITVRDAARNRDITLTVEYPTRGNPSPLIVFSHEYGGSNRAYVGLSSYWASNGYVVIRPSHVDRGGFDAQTDADAQARVKDILAVIDGLDSLEQRYPELQGKIDRTKIAVAGHGLGGQTALLAANDPRIKAVVAMAPVTRGAAAVNKPALFITDQKDDAFKLAGAADQWHVTIENAVPMAYTGRFEAFTEAQAREAARASDPIMDPTMGDRQREMRGQRLQTAMLRTQEMFGIVRGGAVAFLDAYLKGNAEGRKALEDLKDRRGVTVEQK